MKRLFKCGLVLFFFLLAWFLYLGFKSPTNDAQWQLQAQVLPSVEMQGDIIKVSNVRDFRYESDGSVKQINYLDKEYRLSEFKRAWYGISHFGGNNMAHVFLSFEFENQDYLVVSIEARLEKKHSDGYDPIAGAFRSFNKMVVISTEQDVIGLRSHVRGERVLLYSLDVPELYTKPLLLNFLREAQVLTRKPKFYNTLIDNCMTGLLAQSDQFRGLLSWLDWRIVLPGGSDQIAYELGYIDNSKPFLEARARATINPAGYTVEDQNFSQKIRQPISQ